jgi:hypothetical protein
MGKKNFGPILHHSITPFFLSPRPRLQRLDRDFEQRWAGMRERAVDCAGQSLRLHDLLAVSSKSARHRRVVAL